MCRIFQHRWLPALAVFAALVIGIPGVFGQTPAEPVFQIPFENSTQTLDLNAAPEPQPASVVPQPPATPEELGDSLMSHQRYQAAIEAYKKMPNNSADVWNKMGIAYQLMYNQEEASRCYQKSLRIEPRNARVMNNLGTIFDSLKEYSNA
jgi:hypothetical protein